MIIWRGYGILVLVIAGVMAAMLSSFFTMLGANGAIGTAIGTVLSAIAIWFVGNKFNAPEKAQTYIDKQSGREITIKPDHSLFFIKMQYWAFIIGGFGLIMLIGIIVTGKSPL